MACLNLGVPNGSGVVWRGHACSWSAPLLAQRGGPRLTKCAARADAFCDSGLHGPLHKLAPFHQFCACLLLPKNIAIGTRGSAISGGE